MRVPGDTLFAVGAFLVTLFVASLWMGRRPVTSRDANASVAPEAD
jgi:nitric oxide reductase subunit B